MGDETIRPATLADAEAIATLMTGLGYPTGAEPMARRLDSILGDRGYATFVATVDREVIGMLGICLHRHYARDGISGRIVALSVAGDRRGRGVGRRLVRRAEAWVRVRGGERMIVNTHTRRAGAHAFYRALGYQETGLRFVRDL